MGIGLAGLIEAFVMAGAVGAVCYLVTLGLLWRVPRGTEQRARSLGYGLALIATLASAGLPALTANRAGTILWMIAATLALHASQPPQQATGREPHFATQDEPSRT